MAWTSNEAIAVLGAAATTVAAIAAAAVQVIQAVHDVGQKIDKHEEASASRMVTMMKAEAIHSDPPLLDPLPYPKGERPDGEESP